MQCCRCKTFKRFISLICIHLNLGQEMLPVARCRGVIAVSVVQLPKRVHLSGDRDEVQATTSAVAGPSELEFTQAPGRTSGLDELIRPYLTLLLGIVSIVTHVDDRFDVAQAIEIQPLQVISMFFRIGCLFLGKA
jgi:hypothetical protein